MKKWNAKKCWVRRFALEDRGTQMVELAIMLPLLLILFGSIAEFGRYFYTYTTLAKATRLGARYIVTQPFNGTSSTTSLTYKAMAKNMVVCGKTANCSSSDTPVVKNLSASQVDIKGYVCTTSTSTSSVTCSETTSSVPDIVTVKITGYSYQPVLFKLGTLIGSGTFAYPIRSSTTMQYLLVAPAM